MAFSVEERLAALEYVAAANMAADMKTRMEVAGYSREQTIEVAGAYPDEPEFEAVNVIVRLATKMLDERLAEER